MESRACGKVILLGEHAVVYGKPALAIGIEPGASAEYFASDAAPSLALHVAPWNATFAPDDGSDLGRALAAMLESIAPGAPAPRGDVRATIHLPGSGGLGSSAALGVAVARSIGEVLVGRALTEHETLAAALAWEKIFHGNPSGVDHTMAARGGAGLYSRSEGITPVVLRGPLRVLIADTGERTPTRETVAQVARQHERRREVTTQTFEAIASLVRNGALSLTAGDLRSLGQLMDMNQALLSSLLLSTERTETLCRAAREAGALGAKLTGGGGGGCVIALPGESEDKIMAAWREVGAPAFATEVTVGARKA